MLQTPMVYSQDQTQPLPDNKLVNYILWTYRLLVELRFTSQKGSTSRVAALAESKPKHLQWFVDGGDTGIQTEKGARLPKAPRKN
jgi:hypothetical protein